MRPLDYKQRRHALRLRAADGTEIDKLQRLYRKLLGTPARRSSRSGVKKIDERLLTGLTSKERD